MGFLALLDRLNAAHPWSHNDAFAGFVLRQARAVRRRGGDTAVDVGCGTGNLLASLTAVFPTVIGIEPDSPTAATAARRLAETRARVVNRPFGDEPRNAYDLIVFVASLHHTPLLDALQVARRAVRPGGRVVIVGVARETPADTVRSVASLLLNPLVGLVRHPARATRSPLHMQAPTLQATESYDEIHAVASTVLPGIRMRRRLFWRYTASWTAPPEGQGAVRPA